MARFIDEVKIYAKAGDGGKGIVSWRREAHVPRGGPAGGDGGNGGDVVFVADENVSSLLDYKYAPHLRAQKGENGRSKNQHGAQGENTVAKVPIGTQVLDIETEEILADFVEHGQTEVICRGGSGGFGNSRFATATRQAPEFAKDGLPGEERTLRLTLKLMADVGLLGFPNAGKSTLLAHLSHARPKIADYPFTTLVPQLGVVRVDIGRSFVMADIPGLIEGAAEGAGLGFRFLKHLERVRVICHLVEPHPRWDGTADLDHDGEDEKIVPERILVERYLTLRKELQRFNESLLDVPEVVVISKEDTLSQDDAAGAAIGALNDLIKSRGAHLLHISSVTGDGLDALKHKLFELVKKEKAKDSPDGKVKKPFDPTQNL
jgi:GTP-binding protein